MWIIKGIINTILVTVLFSSGFYVRHRLDPAFEAVEDFQDKKESLETTAAKLWPF